MKEQQVIRHTPFSALCAARGLLSRIISNKMVIPRLTWNELNQSVICQGQLITPSTIQKAVVGAIKEAEELLSLLSMGFKFPTFDLISILDDPNNASNGFDYQKHTKNSHILSSCDNFVLYFSKRPEFYDINKKFCRQKVVRWVSQAEKLMKVLAFLIHVTPGQPGRATEMIALNHSNTSVKRNLFFHNGLCILQPSYSKTDSTLQRSRSILRFLPQKVAAILLKYLTFIRPVE